MRLLTKTILPCLVMSLGAPLAMADDPAPPNNPQGTPERTAPPTPAGELPKPVSTHDPAPPVASPKVALPPGGVVEQAGIGGPVGYGRPGVLELGGSFGLTVASGIRDMNLSPSLGWFVADNLELSAIGSVANVKAGDQTATVWSALVEPSYHLPFNRTMFGFLGMGMGAAYEQKLGTGLAIAPRIGGNFLVGRSGILTPALSYEYITHDAMATTQNVTVVAVTSALRVNVGYTVMW
jgi:hypothetical protein